ncbi:MAG: tellurite resistance TerB family protein [Pseudomonadota bacterium]
MRQTLSPEAALIYTMVTMSAAEGEITNTELARIGSLVDHLPAFGEFDKETLVRIAEDCGELLSSDDHGLDHVLEMIAESMPEKLRDTAYAVAVDIAAVDLHVAQEELRFLQLLADRLDLDKLTVAAIERAARARYRKL